MKIPEKIQSLQRLYSQNSSEHEEEENEKNYRQKKLVQTKLTDYIYELNVDYLDIDDENILNEEEKAINLMKVIVMRLIIKDL